MKKKDIKNESANVKNRKHKSLFEKTYPTFEAFHLQSIIFDEADKAGNDMKNLEHFEWKFNGTHYDAIATDNPETVINFA